MKIKFHRRPDKNLKEYSRSEKIAGKDGIILLKVIWIGGGFTSESINIDGRTSKRRRRRDTPGMNLYTFIIYLRFIKVGYKHEDSKYGGEFHYTYIID